MNSEPRFDLFLSNKGFPSRVSFMYGSLNGSNHIGGNHDYSENPICPAGDF